MKQHGAPSAEVATPDAARARARTQLKEGADGAKLFIGALVGGPRGVVHMSPDVARAVVESAHAAHRPVFAHPSTTQGIEIALQAGVDVLAHSTPIDGPWPDGMAQRLVAADMALVPSLKLFEVELRKESVPPAVIERFLAVGQGQLRAFRQAGGQVLFGTDVGYIHDSDPHREYALMAGAGMDWRAILASLTTEPARRFGHGARSGRIAPGMDADLVLLGREPADDVLALSDVVWVMRLGVLACRSVHSKGRRWRGLQFLGRHVFQAAQVHPVDALPVGHVVAHAERAHAAGPAEVVRVAPRVEAVLGQCVFAGQQAEALRRHDGRPEPVAPADRAVAAVGGLGQVDVRLESHGTAMAAAGIGLQHVASRADIVPGAAGPVPPASPEPGG